MYLEASSPNYPSKTAYLTSTSGRYSSISFKYHMYGADMGSLEVQVKTSGAWSQVWVRTGQQHASHTAAWSTAQVTFPAPVDQVRFVGVTGTSSYKGDAGVADVELFEVAGRV